MDEKLIGKISHYFGKISVAIIELTDTLKIGDTIHIKGAHDDMTEEITSMQIEHEPAQEAKAGDSVGIKVPGKIHENDKVYKKK
ncbi:MAG: hypothetical protein KKH94_02710 [Candidatus Omnitrophica bacterium]|nr:hypothetical protein [Candidatus Omnitrophota bacterium]